MHFYFLTEVSGSPGLAHPLSEASEYQPELWKYDVAEFFLGAANGSCYLEMNLAPNGAWWSSIFTKPRQEAPEQPAPVPEVVTKAQQNKDSWQVMARLPLSWLKEHFDFGENSTLNATFILDSPHQIFLTAADLGDGDPNFHRPDRFPGIRPIALA